MMRAGRHERIEAWLYPERDFRFFNNVHSSKAGMGNGHHAIRSGGIRRHAPADPEMDAIFDGLNLSRAMSFKNVAAGLPFGGCKSVVICPPVDLQDNNLLGFIAYCIDRTRSYTGPDMGLSPALADVMNERYSPNFGGGRRGNIGPSGPPTAYGNYLALQAACGFLYGSPSLEGRSAAVMGLGSVGRALAEMLLRDGAHVVACDIDPEAVASLRSTVQTMEEAASGGVDISFVEPDEILTTAADIFAPCAQGGILTERNIPHLRCRMVLGSANNVLRASGQDEEVYLARLLKAHSILYQVEWVHNVGGVISGIETYLRGAEASMEHVNRSIEERVPAMTHLYLETAENEDITPTEVAYREVESRLYG
jgi:glutamate dehydrogenase/leucine dehydrogenase